MMSEPDELGSRLRAIAEDMDRTSERLRQASDAAAAREFRAAGEMAEVTVDGRPRVAGVRLEAAALRLTPDRLDRLLTGLLNDALRQAAAATRAEVLQAMPGAVRRDVADAAGEGR